MVLNMNKDIKALLIIYTILILSGWLIFNNIAHKKELAKLNKDRIEAMKIAVNLNTTLDEYVDMINVMNEESIVTDSLLKEIQEQNEIIKDLRSSK